MAEEAQLAPEIVPDALGTVEDLCQREASNVSLSSELLSGAALNSNG